MVVHFKQFMSVHTVTERERVDLKPTNQYVFHVTHNLCCTVYYPGMWIGLQPVTGGEVTITNLKSQILCQIFAGADVCYEL